MAVTVDKNLGMVGYFPWAIASPRADWLIGDGKNYQVGKYPEADSFYQDQEIDYRVDRPMTSNQGAEGFEAFSTSQNHPNFAAWKAFQAAPAKDDGDSWISLASPTENNPQQVGLKMGNQRHLITRVELDYRFGGTYTPKNVKLKRSDDGNKWYDLLPDIIELSSPTTTIHIPEDKQVLTSAILLEIYSNHGGGVVALSRMRIFAKGVRPPIVKKDMGWQTVMPNIHEWFLRVGKPAES